MKTFLRLFVISLLALVSLASIGATANADKQFKKTVFFDMYYQGQVKPNRIFTTASSGPYFKKLKWSNWGDNRTIARGRFISDCASCGEKENKPARITMRKLIPCPDQKVMTYKYIKLKVVDPDDSHRVLNWPGACPPRGSGRALQG